MNICYFGIYDHQYSRNRILMSGLEKNGCTITECRVDPREHKGIKKYVKLLRQAWALRKEHFDVIIVGFPGQSIVWIAWLVFSQPIIFDVFVSLYDSNVYDRKLYSRFSLRGFRDFFLDYISTHLARVILVDTDAHREYFQKVFAISKEKSIRVFVGAQEDIFYPQPKQNTEKFTVYFHGNFIPLQGVKYIIEAADRVRYDEIQFIIVGTGQDYEHIQQLVREKQLTETVYLVGRKTLTELAAYMKDADVCLGIFGDTRKAERVIPNKVFEALAMGKPIITADTPAIHELLSDGKNVILCRKGDPDDLAQKIIFVKNNPEIRKVLGTAAHTLFQQTLTSEKLAEQLLTELKRYSLFS